MKRIVLLLIIMVETLQLSFGHSKQDTITDTLFAMNFTDVRGVRYKIIQTIDLLDNYWIDSTRKIIVYYDNKKAIIRLPIPDEEVKNFSVERISRNYNGFTLITTQGGSPFIVRRSFFFKIIHHKLYLYKILSEYECFDIKKIEKDCKKIYPKLQIDTFDLVFFL